MQTISYARHRFPPDIIRHAVWLYLRFSLSYRDVEDLLAERGSKISNETIRRWVLKFGPIVACNLRRRRPVPHSQWHLDEMVVSIAGRRLYMWLAVDSEGEVLDVLVQPRRDKAAAFIKARKIVLQYAPLEEDLSGMAYIKDGVGIIGVNALHHPTIVNDSRRRTSLATMRLHAQEIGKAVHVDKGFRVLLRDDVSSQGIDPVEIEANAFASELLMPREFLMSALDAGGLDIEDEAGIEVLARKFRVSASAMRYRLAGRF